MSLISINPRFQLTDKFFSSHKLEEAKITLDKLLDGLGEATDEGGDKASHEWIGYFTASDGTKHESALWDWKGSLIYANYVSIWIDDTAYLQEFKGFIESL